MTSSSGRRRILVVAAALVGGVTLLSAEPQDQRPSPKTVVAGLGLASERVGRVTAHFVPADRARALDMAGHIEGAAALFERELGLSFPVELAALRPDKWFSEFPGVPYAVPWVSMKERLLLVPSSLTEGVMVEGRRPAAAKGLVDFVALHEYGHVAARELYRSGDSADYIPVHWFSELLATYFAYAYVAPTDATWAAMIKQAAQDGVAGYAPKVLSLDWTFMGAMSGRELSDTYAWYQFTLNLQAIELYDKHGLPLLAALRRLSWNRSQTWTTETLLDELQGLTPDLVDWARHFGAGR